MDANRPRAGTLAPPARAQRTVRTIDRVLGRRANLGNALYCARMFRRRSPALVIFSAGRISADHQQILACRQTLVSRPGGENGDIAGIKLEHPAFVAAEANPRVPAGNAQHFVGAGMVMHIRLNAVAPGITPAIPLEQLLKDRGRISCLRKIDRTAVMNERKLRVVGNSAVILEHGRMRLARANGPA